MNVHSPGGGTCAIKPLKLWPTPLTQFAVVSCPWLAQNPSDACAPEKNESASPHTN